MGVLVAVTALLFSFKSYLSSLSFSSSSSKSLLALLPLLLALGLYDISLSLSSLSCAPIVMMY